MLNFLQVFLFVTVWVEMTSIATAILKLIKHGFSEINKFKELSTNHLSYEYHSWRSPATTDV